VPKEAERRAIRGPRVSPPQKTTREVSGPIILRTGSVRESGETGCHVLHVKADAKRTTQHPERFSTQVGRSRFRSCAEIRRTNGAADQARLPLGPKRALCSSDLPRLYGLAS